MPSRAWRWSWLRARKRAWIELMLVQKRVALTGAWIAETWIAVMLVQKWVARMEQWKGTTRADRVARMEKWKGTSRADRVAARGRSVGAEDGRSVFRDGNSRARRPWNEDRRG